MHPTQVEVLSHTRLVPQLVPAGFWVPSMQTGEPLVHTVVPFLQAALPFVPHAAPTVHATQLPEPLHTWFEPHEVPGLTFIAESTQVDAPVAHEVTPTLQAVGLPPQGWPAVHDTQALAALQTRFAPQEVPTALALPSRQVVVPVAHEVTPLKHAELGLVPQG